MNRKFTSLMLVLAMLLSLLTGCGKANAEAEYFYAMADEMLSMEDVQVEASIPYYGVELIISGFAAPTQRKADFILSFSGTEQSDGPFTELRAEGSQAWLNVRQLAEQTLTFELYDYYREDIEMFYEEQFADWLIYEMDEKFWQGIPGWGETLSEIWEETKGDIGQYITGTEDEAVLTLTAGQMKTLLGKVGNRLLNKSEVLQEGFITFAEQESQLMSATQMNAHDFAESITIEAETWFAGVADGSQAVSGGTVTLRREGDSYQAELKLEDGRTWSIRLSAPEKTEIERPYSIMEFEAYGDEAYYLATFGSDYICAMLSGEEQNEQLQQLYAAEQENSYAREEMTTGTIAGYDDLLSIQFVPENGRPMTLPILCGFLGNSVERAGENSPELLYVSLLSDHWEQEILTEYYEGKKPEYFLEDTLFEYYNAYINISGLQLVQDLSELQCSASGSALTQGFVYREDNYSDDHAVIMIVLPQEGLDCCGFIQLDLYPTQMSEKDKLAVMHLFEYLGLECPVDMGV